MATTRVRAVVAARPARRFPPGRFPASVRSRLCGALVHEHTRWPFSPSQARDAADRSASALERLGLNVTMVRGVVDVGGAELDHLWVVADGRVVDASLPLNAPSFVEALRAYVAGDLDDDELDRAAHPYSLRWRVLGEFPTTLRYLGLPVWHQRDRTSAWAGRPGR